MRKNEPYSHTYGRTTRFIAFLLAFVIIFGLMPFSSFPVFAAVPDNMPETITLMDANSGGYGVKNYQSPNGLGKCGIHSFTMDVGDGAAMIGFCCAHDKALNDNYRGHPWHFTSKVNAGDAANHPYLPFLDWWMYRMEVSWGLDLQYPDKTEEEKQALNNDYMNEWERQYTNAWVQATIWLTIAGIFTNCDDPEQIKKVAAERDAVLRAFDIDVDASPWPSETLLTEWRDKWKNGDYNKRNYYLYTPESDYVQPILITQVFPEDVEDSYGYIQVEKTDQSGTPLKNATFTIYDKSSCSAVDVVSTITTDGSGHGVSSRLDFQGDSFTFYVKETSAPSGYTGSSQVYQVTVSATANNTPETAAKVNGGNPVINTTGPGPEPSTPESVIRKVDQDGNGIGPATFRLKSLENGIEMEVSCDVTGSLELQWTNKSGDNYIEPGEYTVTEITPPPGYEKTDEAKNLRLWVETGSGGEQIPRSSGPLTFTNNKKPSIIISKIDASGKGLSGAAFDIYYNGKLVGSATTGNDGTFTYMGEDGKGLGTGYYEFVETKAPDGYLIPFVHHQGIFVNAETMHDPIQLTFTNEEYPEIIIQKVSAGTEERLAGAVFEVKIDGQDFGQVGPTDDTGTIVLDYDTYGKFLTDEKDSWTIQVREVVAPDGYLIDDPDWQTAELIRGQILAPFVFSDTKYPEITIVKRDTETGEPLPNTSFKVAIDGVEVGTFVTDDQGMITIDYETYGRFLDEENYDNWTVTVTETEMPEGYNKDKQEASGDYTLTQQLKFGQDLVEFEFKDTSFRDIEIIKRDSETGWALAGATFTLKSISLDDPNKGTISREGQTDETGRLRFEDLPNGTYEITETVPPSGYELADPVKQTIIVTSDSDPVIEVEYENAPKEGLLIRKEDSVTKQPLAGVEFEVRYLGSADAADGTTNAPRSYITDENGLIYLPDCKAGWYEIREVAVPDGYVLDPEPRMIEIVNTHVPTTVTFQNYQDGQLVILKKDAQTGLPLPGALFKITTAGGNFIATVETGANGYATLNGLEPGSYVVTEIEAPDGHLIDPTPQTFELRKGQTEPIFLLFYNDGKTNIYVRKEDAQTHIGLEGAVYKVTLTDGKIVKDRLVTGEDGLAALTDLDPGSYVITEIEAPKGYLLNSTPQTIAIEEGQTKTVVFRNNKPGGIAILKTDAISGLPLAGAEFDLFSMDDKLLGHYTTGQDGYIRISDLEAGYYFVQETKAPEGYLLDSTKHKIEVKDFEVTLVELENYEKAGLTIQKVDAESKIPLSGATFGVYDMHGALLKNVTTNSSGIASVNGLQPGWYKVIELSAPLGYILDSQEHLVEIVEGKPATITVANTPQSGITVKKVDATNKEPLAGAVFELYTADDTLVGTYTTDKGGSFVTDKVEPGTYFLVETKAPEGYVIDTKSTKVIVKENENPVVTIENHKGTTIQILKTDAVTGAYLEGAEFEVWTLNCTKLLGTYVTDKTGMVYTDPLPAGNYVVIESKAPQGYALDDTHHHVNLTYDHPYILKVSDQPLTAIMITKVSTVDDEPLLGAKFQVRTAEGDVIGEYTTDTTGTATTPVLEPGVYYVKEVEAPDGYLLNDQVFRVEVKAGTMATLVVEDTPEASLVIFKGDSNTKKGIAGAVFKVETADGDFIGQYTTDAQGEALIRPIAPGHYIVTEMSAPEGYLVSETPRTITVKAGVVNRVEFMDAEKGSLIIRLEDQADGHKLENGRFELYWAATGEKVAEGVTDNAGSIVWGSLNPGRYIIKHTFAPDGYTIVDEEKEGIVVSGDTKIVVFQDCTAGLVIEKLDKLTTEPLAGARFQVTRNSDNIVIGEYVTDNDGLALVSGLIPGMYTVEEIEAPDGYAIDEPSRLVHVKAGQQAHVTFTNTPFAGITINAVDKDNNKPLSGIVFEVWHQNGELVNTYTTDSTGMIQTDKLTAGYYTIKVIKTENGYTAVTSEQTVQIKDGIAVTAKFEFIARGILQIYALNSKEQGLPGMKVTITKQNGEFVGNYTADGTGLIKVPNLEPGWYVVTETQAPDGYTIDGEASQSIQVTSNGDTILKFYHGKTYGVQIRTSVKQTGEMVPGVVYQITKLDGSVVGSYTSDQVGLVYVSLEPGWYVIKQTSLPEGFKNYSLCGSRNIEVKADTPTVVDFQLTQLSSIRVKFVDGSTDAAIYGVHVLLKDSAGTIVDEYVSDNEGYITLKQSVVNGTYTLQQIAVPNGYYTVDSVPKTIEVLNGETTEIVWRMYNQAGQIQVHVTSSAYNSTLDLAAGSNLQGAVFEIYNPFTYAVVATITSDSYGVAASNGLPIGRYIIREKSPAPYFGMSGKETEVYIKINNDVVRVEYQQAPTMLNTSNTLEANNNVVAGTSMKYVFTAVNNNSTERLDNFFWNIKVPTDAIRAGTLFTGSWSSPVFYSISYKTNMNDYRPLATGLSGTSSYQYDLSSLAVNVQGGEYVTDIRFEFGTVPAGFKPVVSPVFYGYVMPNVVNGYKIILRSECGGKYGESWNTASALWTTTVIANNANLPSTLPKTGY